MDTNLTMLGFAMVPKSHDQWLIDWERSNAGYAKLASGFAATFAIASSIVGRLFARPRTARPAYA